MKECHLFLILLLNCGNYNVCCNNWTFLSKLQELCPFSSFCEENATMSLLEDDTTRPCCESCSCNPGCEEYDNCCYDSNSSSTSDTLRKCTSPIVSNINRISTNYVMIYSCPYNFYEQGYSNSTPCSFNENDYKSFAPVVSQKTGDIYVNAECAFCNNIHDISSWQLTVNCPQDKEDPSYDTVKLLQGVNIGSAGCYLSYIPPKHINLETRECRDGVIRECNVSGRAIDWEPVWDYCPMFNATFSRNTNTFYGNIFCYMCNEDYPDRIAKICGKGGSKNPTGIPFTVVLDNVQFTELDGIRTSHHSNGECRTTEVLVNSFETGCRRVGCSWGQFRVGDKCGFYSKEWIGGPFTAVLKLTPLDRTQKIDKPILSDMQFQLKKNIKARWLKRNAMRNWNIETLYKPSDDEKHVEYLVAFSSYPNSNVNPSTLVTTLRRTLKETWILDVNNRTFRLHVQFHRYRRYEKRLKEFWSNYGVKIDEQYAYANLNLQGLEIVEERYLYSVSNISIDYSSKNEFLNELFLCKQVELRPNEFEIMKGSRLLFKVTNTTLNEGEYRIIEAGDVSICLDRFYQNNGFTSGVHHFQFVVFVAFTWELLT